MTLKCFNKSTNYIVGEILDILMGRILIVVLLMCSSICFLSENTSADDFKFKTYREFKACLDTINSDSYGSSSEKEKKSIVEQRIKDRKRIALNVINTDVITDYIKKKILLYKKQSAKKPYMAGRILAWDALYYIESAIDLYEITNEQKYLYIVKDFYDYLIPLRDSERGYYDEFTGKKDPTWGSETWGYYMTNITWTGRICYPALKYAYLVMKRNKKEFYQSAKYYVSVMEEALMSHNPLLEKLIYGSNYRGLYSGFLEAFNHLPSVIASFIYLAKIDNIDYEKTANQIAENFIKSIQFDNDGNCSWGYAYDEVRRKKYDPGALNPEQIWKAHETVQIIRHLDSSGLLSDNTIPNCIANNFLFNIYSGRNPRTGKMSFSPYIAHFPRQRFNYETMPKKYSAYLSWIYFGKYDPKITEVLINYLSEEHEKFPYLWLTDGNSLRAYVIWSSNREK